MPGGKRHTLLHGEPFGGRGMDRLETARSLAERQTFPSELPRHWGQLLEGPVSLILDLRARARKLRGAALWFLLAIVASLAVGAGAFAWLPIFLASQDTQLQANEARRGEIRREQEPLNKEIGRLEEAWKAERKADLPRLYTAGTKVAPPDGYFTNDMRDMHIAADAKTGWAVGEGGDIRATKDAGATWTQQTSGNSATLLAVHFAADAKTGWAVGRGGEILLITPMDLSAAADAETVTDYIDALENASPPSGANLTQFIVNPRRHAVELQKVNENLSALNTEMKDLGSFGLTPSSGSTGTRLTPCDYLQQVIPGNADKPKTDTALAREIIKSCEYNDVVSLTRNNLTRLGVVGFIIFFIALLVGLYRYNMRLAAFYDGRADALSLGRPEQVGFDTLVDKFSPDAVGYGKQPTSPLDQVATLAGKITGRS